METTRPGHEDDKMGAPKLSPETDWEYIQSRLMSEFQSAHLKGTANACFVENPEGWDYYAFRVTPHESDPQDVLERVLSRLRKLAVELSPHDPVAVSVL